MDEGQLRSPKQFKTVTESYNTRIWKKGVCKAYKNTYTTVIFLSKFS
jgi:hypothetical protein